MRNWQMLSDSTQLLSQFQNQHVELVNGVN